MDEMDPEQLSCFFLLAIQRHLSQHSSTKDTAVILAETFAQLQQNLICKEENSPHPDPDYIAALGTLVYYKKH